MGKELKNILQINYVLAILGSAKLKSKERVQNDFLYYHKHIIPNILSFEYLNISNQLEEAIFYQIFILETDLVKNIENS